MMCQWPQGNSLKQQKAIKPRSRAPAFIDRKQTLEEMEKCCLGVKYPPAKPGPSIKHEKSKRRRGGDADAAPNRRSRLKAKFEFEKVSLGPGACFSPPGS